MVSYEYESNNGNLLKVLYGNGDYLRYDYDRQDRISITWFYSAAEKAEKKLYSYVYNKQGELARVTDADPWENILAVLRLPWKTDACSGYEGFLFL